MTRTGIGCQVAAGPGGSRSLRFGRRTPPSDAVSDSRVRRLAGFRILD